MSILYEIIRKSKLFLQFSGMFYVLNNSVNAHISPKTLIYLHHTKKKLEKSLCLSNGDKY